VKLKTKITITKEQKKTRIKLEKIIYHKFGLKDEIWNKKKNLYKRVKKKNQKNKKKIKRIRTKLEKIKYYELGLKDEIEKQIELLQYG